MSKPLRLGLLGLGSVGTGFLNHFQSNQGLTIKQEKLSLNQVAVRQVTPEREAMMPAGCQLVGDWRAVVNNPEIDLVAEAMGVDPDGTPSNALEAARISLNSGKDFVTSNKNLIALHGPELFRLAEEKGRNILFESTVCAGTPLLAPLYRGLASIGVTAVHGILNGTCNFILSEMETRGLSMEEGISLAQKLGYAESDPSADVDGFDPAYKLLILAGVVFGKNFRLEDVEIQGIRSISPTELSLAKDHGLKIKLMGSIHRLDCGKFLLRIRPVLLKDSHSLARVDGAMNALEVQTESLGAFFFMGPGAGGEITAAGMLSDATAISRSRKTGGRPVFPTWPEMHEEAGALHNHRAPYYLRAGSEFISQLTAFSTAKMIDDRKDAYLLTAEEFSQCKSKLIDLSRHREDICVLEVFDEETREALLTPRMHAS